MLCVFRVATWFLKNQKKIKGTASSHSMSIVPNRDFESGRSHLLFDHFLFITLDTWLSHHSSFGVIIDIYCTFTQARDNNGK